MELWNDFEGKVVDGRFPLERLIGPKGRSAFFTTKDEAGGPAVIRLIESLNDEDEILGRWRKVAALKDEHLLAVKNTGQTVLDGTHLVYAVLEPSDAELADVLRERSLTVEETRQVALSVIDGLKALHAANLIHDHVDAEHVLAQGELVKLRSDVVRETPEGPEGAQLRKADVRNVALLLLQCLTQRRDLRSMGATRLPALFEEVIRRGENGAWGLEEMSASLRPAPPVAPAVATASAARPATTTAPTAAAGAASVAGAAAASVPLSAVTRGPQPGASTSAALPPAEAQRPKTVAERLRTSQEKDRLTVEPDDEPKRTGLLVAIGAGVLLLVLLGIYFLRAGRAGQSKTVVQETPSAVTAPDQSSENRPPARDAHPAVRPAPAPAPAVAESTAPASVRAEAPPSDAAQWRVVAFTYNREEQARSKAEAIAAKHPALKPEVFTPTGRAPYLVAVGGWMTAEQANALKRRARREGLPRDTYATNYKGRNR